MIVCSTLWCLVLRAINYGFGRFVVLTNLRRKSCPSLFVSEAWAVPLIIWNHMKSGCTVISLVFFLSLSFFSPLFPRNSSESTISPGLSHWVNPNNPLQSIRLNYRSYCSQNPHPHTPMHMWHFPETFSHNTLTLVENKMEAMQGEGSFKRMCQWFRGDPPPKKKPCILPPFVPSTLRDTTQTAQLCELCQRILFVLWKKLLRILVFSLTFHTVNQAGVSNGTAHRLRSQW